ncbi:MAG TPA: M1 family metallopeptidase, partial [Chitinophagaceae bacterium]
MKKLLLLLIITLLVNLSYSQYWQQQVNFLIEVSLNEKEKTLDGFERLEYINNSPDTLTYIWFHIWPNAYKNDKTAFSDQLLRNGNTKFYFSDKEEKGYMNRLDFKVNGQTARTEDHPQYIDIIKVILPTALHPNEKVIISTPFHVKLPFNFSRGGYDGASFQVTQWYPKPAVYDQNGWHPMPYLDQGEFFSEFGNYDVRITVPKDFVVAATGQLQNEDEISWLRSRTTVPALKKTISSKTSATKSNSKNAPRKPVEETVDVSPSGTKSLRYLQENVHDFAWFANKDFIVNYDTCQLQSGRVIDVYTFYTEKEKEVWKNSVQFSKDAIQFYSNEVGEYPYSIVSAVQGPPSFGGGMEYPTITVISPMASEKQLDAVLAHEIGHNWFYGILANNERAYPWMDEGLNSFYDKKYLESKYGNDTNEEELVFQTLVKQHKDQPITTRSEDFTGLNYGLVAYHKTAVWLQLIEEKIGEDKFKKTI